MWVVVEPAALSRPVSAYRRLGGEIGTVKAVEAWTCVVSMVVVVVGLRDDDSWSLDLQTLSHAEQQQQQQRRWCLTMCGP